MPEAKRDAYYKKMMLNQYRRMQMAEKVASLSGLLGRSPARRLTTINLIARCLYNFEKTNLIAITDDLLIKYKKEPVDIFEVMANVLEGQRINPHQSEPAAKIANQIRKKCTKLFTLVDKELPAYAERPVKHLFPFWNQPFLYAAAKDVIASRYLNEEERHYYNISGTALLPQNYLDETHSAAWRALYQLMASRSENQKQISAMAKMTIPALIRKIIKWQLALDEKAGRPVPENLLLGENRLNYLLNIVVENPVIGSSELESSLRQYLLQYYQVREFEHKIDHVVTRTTRFSMKELNLFYGWDRQRCDSLNAPKELQILPPAVMGRMKERGVVLDEQPETFGQKGVEDPELRYFKFLKNGLLADRAIKSLQQDYELLAFCSDNHWEGMPHPNTADQLRSYLAMRWTGATFVLGGDSKDLWRSPDEAKIKKANPLIFNALSGLGDKVVWLRGNHDAKLKDALVYYYKPEWGLYLEHGDQNDSANSTEKPGSPIGEYITRFLVRPLDSIFGSRATKFLEYLQQVGTGLSTSFKRYTKLTIKWLSEEGMINTTTSRMIKLQEEKGVKIYCQGHIHSPLTYLYYKKMIKAIANTLQLARKMIFILTYSWKDNTAGAGGIVWFAKRRDNPTGPVMIYQMIWPYLDAQQLMEAYKHPTVKLAISNSDRPVNSPDRQTLSN
ncbi:MAG: metallophosphoesterase [Candidatus Margulisbacteria bacterium]|nr:metallophosphoesterase [Candidatus Margulisiibacteriota bacterium]